MDIVQQYFHSQLQTSAFEAGRSLVAVLDQGIGYYGHAKEAAFRRMFNPVTWLAWFLERPLVVLERARIKGGNRIYEGFIRGLMVLILLLLAQKLGLPLDELIGPIINLFK